MGRFWLQNQRCKTASPYGPFWKLGAPGLRPYLWKTCTSICMLVIAEPETCCRIIYVLLLWRRAGQPAQAPCPALQVQRGPGAEARGAARPAAGCQAWLLSGCRRPPSACLLRARALPPTHPSTGARHVNLQRKENLPCKHRPVPSDGRLTGPLPVSCVQLDSLEDEASRP